MKNDNTLRIPDEEPVTRPVSRKKKASKGSYRGLLRPSDALVAAFVVPVVVMIIIFTQRGIFPFGEQSFLRTDMYHQYAPFFSEFQHKLKEGSSLLYSWNIGMGVNFTALYAYYLASPLNWLLIVCPKSLVIEFMTYSIVLKIGLSGLTMAWYLRKRYQREDFGVAFFGIFYALSGYMAAYSWNIMWLDCILLFPLIMLGVERLVKEKKGMLYCITLGLAILSNYYISIMICVFMVLYFISLLILEEKMGWIRFISRCGWFTLYSLLAGGMSAIILLPEIYALQMTASGDVSFPKTVSSYFSIFDMIARHIVNVKTEIGLDHWPNIYCGVAVLMFFLLYLGCRKIRAREKAVYCTLLLFFFASFSINVLNFIWHGFHYPNSLPCRQSFIYIFLMLVICYRAYMYLEETPDRHITMAFVGAAGFVILAEKLVTEEHFHFSVYYISLIFLALYAGLVFMYRKGRKYRTAALLLTLSVVAVEAAVNTTLTSITTTSRTSYLADNAAVEKLAGSLYSGSDFYRVEKVTRKTKNDGAWMNFPSVSLFSSTANADLSAFFKKLGCESSTNAYSITGSTPLVDMLLGVRYGLYTGAGDPSGIRSLIDIEDETYLYENHYSMPIAWMVSPYFEADWYLDAGNPADVQNRLADLTGSSHVLLQVNHGLDESSAYSFDPGVSGDYYAYIDNKKVEKVTVTIGDDTKTFNNVNRGFLLELGYCEAGTEVIIRSETSGEDLSAMVYRFSEEALGEVYANLNREPLVLDSWDATTMKGTVMVRQEGVLLTTIPYDPGWTVLVDGEVCETEKALESFLSVRLPEGSHEIELEYEPQGLKPGALITAASLLILLAVYLGGRHLEKQRIQVIRYDDHAAGEDPAEGDPEQEERDEEEWPEEEWPVKDIAIEEETME